MTVKGFSPAVRVAAGATAAIAVVYVIGAVVLNLVVARHMTQQDDDQLGDRLTVARHHPEALRQREARAAGSSDLDADGAPVFLWAVNDRGVVVAHSPGAPALPRAQLIPGALHDGMAVGATLGATAPFRLKVAKGQANWLVAGRSVAGDRHTRNLLLDAEVIAGPFLLLAMFLGLLLVGLRALAPVEQSRRRQLEFTADASHELRTPLSVIRAEADVALSAPREAHEYRDSLRRIQGESRRLRQLVEDMLWLARFDSKPPPPGNEPVDPLRRRADQHGAIRGLRADRGADGTEPVGAGLGQGGQVDRLAAGRRRLGVEPGQPEHVLHQLPQPLALALDPAQ